ncbi:DNA internalization-related competence protein ComEC/Rec2 [Limosilactobacillus fastidiosus]|uniref:DNA internalization-related competence protein ComEC/Rec2 n=1 Tax=Limosilactobacillus fastidiosus TaxID=2759855 RepID=UPI001E588C39|nr:DNA internalization-related competence protein ComEC/Rec2 [Limosilactobacillus fastidiosus]MCD7083396.1 DNA internalization-related competence protein ComEC/Rec2 [Limosilactobacillus fastidiosus]
MTTVNQQSEVNGKAYTVLPDQVTIKANLINAQATDCQTGERVSLVYFPQSEREAQKICQCSNTMKWMISGDERPIEPATNFNQFYSQRYYHQFHIYNQVRCKQLQIEIEQEANFFQKCHILRACLYHYFESFPHPLAGYCQQLILGMKNTQTAELMKNVKRLGLLHLFCISGMHVVLLTDCLRKVLIRLHFNREDIEWLLMIVLPFYLIIGGGSVSLVRAIIMAEMGLLQRLTRLSSLDGWATSLLGGLIVDPWLLLTLGGQLSYLLSFALQVIPDNIHGFRQSLLLNLISLPSILAFVYEVHLLTFICSFLIIPVFSTFIFPAVIISALLFHYLPLFPLLINNILRGFEWLLGEISYWPGMISFGKPTTAVTWLLFFATLFLIDHYRVKPLLVLGGLYLLVFMGIHVPLSGEVTFVDIGQGDSAIIRYPVSNRVEMIDTGGKLRFGRQSVRSQSDYAMRTSVNYLKSCGISKIDTIYLSHHDVDHIGYLTTILQNFKVQKVVVPSGMERQRTLLKLVPTDSLQVPQIIPVKNDDVISKSKLYVLHPFNKGEGNNEDSMVLAGTFGQLSFMFMGDLDRHGEREIIRNYPELRVDILKLGHHGSKTSSDPRFIKQVAPQIGIISAGRQNRYGHPNQETLLTLHKNNIKAISTQQYGMIRYRYSKINGHWQTKLKGDEYRWMLPRLNNK